MSKSDLKAVDPEAERMRAEFRDAFNRANKSDAKDTDAGKVRKLLVEHADLELWRDVPGPMTTAEAVLLSHDGLTPAVVHSWRARAACLRADLGHEDAPQIEKLIIQHVALCWLRLSLVGILHAQFTNGTHDRAAGLYWDRRLNAAQRRFERATLQLARFRKLSAQAERAKRDAEARPLPLRVTA